MADARDATAARQPGQAGYVLNVNFLYTPSRGGSAGAGEWSLYESLLSSLSCESL